MEDAKSKDFENDQSNQIQEDENMDENEAEAASSLHETGGSHKSVEK